jgi:Fe2+ transport system protein FeoA
MMEMELREIRSLNNLAEGETGEIIQVRGKPETHRYLYTRGLIMGRKLSVSNNTVSPEMSLVLMPGNGISTIGKDIASNIKVRLIS